MKFPLLLLSLALSPALTPAASPSPLDRDNLVAWCIVPFDATHRTPEQRAEMLVDLGVKRYAYDWREEHIPTFEREIVAAQKHGIEFFAFWRGHPAAFALFQKYAIHPQIWQTLPRPPATLDQADKIEAAVAGLIPLAQETAVLGCPLGLYNHGGWSGEPDNLIAVCQRLRELGHDHVGIVYNFHHAHEHIANWATLFPRLQPYLLCLNLNGMVTGGDKRDQKIVPLGQGDHEAAMLQVVIASGYTGPIGVLDHLPETDSKITLQRNLAGLNRLRAKSATATP